MRQRRQQKAKELLLRRFHSDVRKLKKQCKELGIDLHTYDAADVKETCVLSSSDYELWETKANCSSENENYFLDDQSYEIFVGRTNPDGSIDNSTCSHLSMHTYDD